MLECVVLGAPVKEVWIADIEGFVVVSVDRLRATRSVVRAVAVAVADFCDALARDRPAARVRMALVDRLRVDQAFGLIVRSGPKHHGDHNTEYGCISADSQRERDHSNSGEARILSELPQCILNVLQDVVKHAASFLLLVT